MSLHKPTHEEFAETARALGLHLSDAEVDEYLAVAGPALDAYRLLDATPDALPVVKYPRTPGQPPSAADNPYNAWFQRCEIRGADHGPLHGKTFAIKDHVCVAGVPMMNGSTTLRGYVPQVDATVVTRILDAGGTILGKSHCELYCTSGGSHTNAMAPVVNPRKAGHTAGGSSSGSAALVASGAVDMAIGGDQAGSIRNPSAFCGVVGMKPTFGLVPYTGAIPLASVVDSLGPITAGVADNARFLQVLAGSDGLDGRQADVQVGDYLAALDSGLAGMKIGLLREGFGMPGAEADVDAQVRKGVERLGKLGARVAEVSVPEHRDLAPAVWSIINFEAAGATAMHGNLFGFDVPGLYIPSLIRAYDSAATHLDDTSEMFKALTLVGSYMLRRHHGYYYARAQNLRRRVIAAYDAALNDCDLLVLPTAVMKAPPLPEPEPGIGESCLRSSQMLWNTAPFNITGHPALSVPCGALDGLPIGLMLVGPKWGEATIYRAAKAFEDSLRDAALA